MAGVNFKVDAVLGDTTKLQQQIQSLKTNLQLTIDNTQALQSIRQVQQQINALQKSMNNMNFNFSVGRNGGKGGTDSTYNGRGVKAQFETVTLQKTSELYNQIRNTVNGTVSDIKVIRDEQGKIVGGTVQVSNGFQTWKRNLEFVDGEFQRVLASGRDTISLDTKSNAMYHERIQHLKNISNLKIQLMTATGDEKKVLEQQLEVEQQLSKAVANRISRKNSNGVPLYQTAEGEAMVAETKQQIAQAEALARARLNDKQIIIEQNENFRQQLSLTREIEALKIRSQTATTAENTVIQEAIQRKESLLQQLQTQTQLTQAQQQEIIEVKNKAKLERDIVEIKRQQLNASYGNIKGEGLFGVNSDELVKQTQWFRDLNAQYNNTATIVKSVKSSTNQYGESLSQCTVRVKNAKNQWETYNATINNSTGQLRVLKGQTSDVINSQMNLNSMLKSAIERFAVWGIAMKMWTGIGNAINDCTNYVKDLNEAMTNIRVVTMDTKEATDSLLKTYNQLGQELGANTLDIANGAIDWLRQGYSQADTTELVKDSTILSKLALIDNAQATEYLTSALKGYKLEAQDAIGVIDQLVSIDLEAATSAGDMAEAMSRTANMARTSGFEMNELLGIIATVSEVTQNSASTVGNSMKTLLSRMSNVKAGVEIDEETGESLNDVEKVLNRVGIALRDNQGNWYDFYDILDQIAYRWSEFSDIQKSQITTALGGTRQRENVLVMLENWDKVKQYAETGANASGTAMEKYGIVLESVSAKQEQLTAKVQEFYSNILNSDFISKLLDIGSSFMDMMNSADGLTGKIIVLTGVLVGLTVVLKTLKTTTLYTQFISLLSTFKALAVGAVTLNGAFLSVGTQGIGALLLAIPKAIIGLISLTANFGFAEVSALGLKGALDLLNINPVMLAISALIAVVAGGIAIFKHFNVTLEEQHEKAQQAQSDYEEVKNELQSVNDELKTTQQRIAELESKGSLTFVEKKELENLKATNAELEKRQYWLNLEAEQKKKTATEEAKKAWDKDFNKSGEYISRYQTHQEVVTDAYGNPTVATQTVYNSIDETQYIKEQIRYYGELEQKIKDLSAKRGQWTEDENKQYESLVAEQEKAKAYLETVGARIQTDFIDAYDVDDATKKEWTDLQDIISNTLNPKSSDVNISDLLNKQGKDFTNYYIQIAKNGELTTEKFSESFKRKVKEAFNIDDNDTQSLESALQRIVDYFNNTNFDTTNIENSISSISDGLSTITDKLELLNSVQEEYDENGSLSSKTLENISKQYPDMAENIALYIAGLKTEQELLNDLQSCYDTDLTNYENLIKSKLALNPEFYNGLSDSQKQQIEMLFSSYGVDFQNFKTAEEAKLNFNAQIISTLAERWSHYNGKSLEYLKSMKSAMESDKARFGIDYGEEYYAISDAISDIEGFNKQFDDIVFEGVKFNPKSFENKTKSANKTSDALTELKESIEALERPADIIDKKIKAMGDIDTVSEMNNQYDLLSQKLQIVNKNLSVVQNKLNNKNLTKEQREYLEDKMYEYQAEIVSIQDSLDDIRLDKLKEQLEDLQKPIDDVDNKIKQLGDINTVQEKAKESELLAQKFRLVSNNIATINKLLKDTTLSQDMRDLLNEELQNLIVEQVSIRDDIEGNVRDAVELEKENAQLQAELNYKQQLYELELKLYGDTGKELYEHQQEEEIKRLQEIIDARNEEKDVQDKIAEEQEYQNKLLEAKINLQNALNNKTVKILTKQEDGTWQYEYSANMSDVKDAQDELADIQKEYDDWKYEQETDRIQQEIDAIQKEVDEKSEMYDDMEFHLNQSLEKQTNAIEQYYADIDKITQDRMAQYQKTYGDAWDKVIGIAQSRLDTLTALNTQLQGQSEYAFEVIGSDNTYVKKVQSFDVGGKIQGSGLAFVHNKERVLTAEQNAYFEQFVTKLPSLIKAIDITKFNGYSGIQSSSIKEKFDKTVQTIISKVECVFPNITTTDGLQQAILELPRLALQKS